ncbi:FK506-binding protein 5-like [Haliotis asinina]|uniref:FK506-binding protein 5-like n=1 Tax=Haliotis asinina TaxID=109174 RepID=UPI0035318E8D
MNSQLAVIFLAAAAAAAALPTDSDKHPIRRQVCSQYAVNECVQRLMYKKGSMNGGYNPNNGINGGYNPNNGINGGYNPNNGINGGYNPNNGINGGYNPNNGINGGYNPNNGINGGYNPNNGINGGYNPNNGINGGYNPNNGMNGDLTNFQTICEMTLCGSVGNFIANMAMSGAEGAEKTPVAPALTNEKTSGKVKAP